MYIHVQCQTWHLLGEIQSADGSFDYVWIPCCSARGAWQPNLECVFSTQHFVPLIFGFQIHPTLLGFGLVTLCMTLVRRCVLSEGVSLVGSATVFHVDLSSSGQYWSYLYKGKRRPMSLSIVPLWVFHLA